MNIEFNLGSIEDKKGYKSFLVGGALGIVLSIFIFWGGFEFVFPIFFKDRIEQYKERIETLDKENSSLNKEYKNLELKFNNLITSNKSLKRKRDCSSLKVLKDEKKNEINAKKNERSRIRMANSPGNLNDILTSDLIKSNKEIEVDNELNILNSQLASIEAKILACHSTY